MGIWKRLGTWMLLRCSLLRAASCELRAASFSGLKRGTLPGRCRDERKTEKWGQHDSGRAAWAEGEINEIHVGSSSVIFHFPFYSLGGFTTMFPRWAPTDFCGFFSVSISYYNIISRRDVKFKTNENYVSRCERGGELFKRLDRGSGVRTNLNKPLRSPENMASKKTTAA